MRIVIGGTEDGHLMEWNKTTPFRSETPRRCEAKYHDCIDYTVLQKCPAAGVHLRTHIYFLSSQPSTEERWCCAAHDLLWDWEIRMYLRKIRQA
jgi:hypothetical protein